MPEGHRTSEETWIKVWNKSEYDKLYKINPIDSLALSAVSKVMRSTQPQKVLEAGSGTGKLALNLKGLFPETDFTLLDYSEKAIENSKKYFGEKGVKANFCHGDMFNMKAFKDNAFDLVYSSGVLEHFEFKERVKALAEIKRVTKKGGIIVTLVPYKYAPLYRLGKKLAEIRKKWEIGLEIPLSTMRPEHQRNGLNPKEHAIGGLTQATFVPVLCLIAEKMHSLNRKLYNSIDYKLPGYLLSSVARKE